MAAEHEAGRTRRSNELGPVGERLARNVAEIRGKSPSTYELARRLERLGRPILPSAITKIEAGQRRVDVDDLVALALALDVSPNRLILPGSADDTKWIQLTAEDNTVTERDAWLWARGEKTLFAGTHLDPPEPGKRGEVGKLVWHARETFPRFNRPDLEPDPPMEAMGPHWADLQSIWLKARDLAKEIGCSVDVVLRWVKKAEPVEVGSLETRGIQVGSRPVGDSESGDDGQR